MLNKLISGAQTGADRAALYWAISHDIPQGAAKEREACDLQEVPGSNPGSPIFPNLVKLLRSEEVRLISGDLRVRQFAKGHLEIFAKAVKCWESATRRRLRPRIKYWLNKSEKSIRN